MLFLRQRLGIFAIFLAMASSACSAEERLRNIMYLTGQHPIIPSSDLSSPITHVVLAFMQSSSFNVEAPNPDWPLFMSIAETRSRFRSGTKIMVAIGGWGDTNGFDTAARTERSRERFANNVAAMVRDTEADGVDVDWEYPGGNGEDYKQIPNTEKAWEIDAYPLLLSAIRSAIGPNKVISAAVPGIPRDMLAFTPTTLPSIMASVDFLNVMAYDLMNRRDQVTKHHTGVQLSLESIDQYIDNGAIAERLNLGFAFYVKYFRISPENHEQCLRNPVGCPTGLMEDPDTGADLGKTGGFSWHDSVPDDVNVSFTKALTDGSYDDINGGYYYWDEDEDLWWTFDNPAALLKKFPLIVRAKRLGGVFAWGLGEDAPEFKHLRALNQGLKKLEDEKDEL
ncbi:putative Chitinase 18-4 [Seiridium unicorne]|uniref:chitinase n=1 Tax=Seiridium unicorne TaxID=138068 RepID=A0ABR2V288_9PEZI